jgi:hyperosmotically inducible periplasmic protein
MYKQSGLKTGLMGSLVAVLVSLCAGTASATKSDDAALATKVKAALIENNDTKARQINVEVSQGKVQLAGFVDSAEQKIAAGKVAANVVGVQSVQNNLQVKLADRSAGQVIDDGVLTAKVKAALIGDARTKAYQIDVNSREGVVQLNGFVDNPTAKSAAVEVTKSVSGVLDVQDKLAVK